MALIPKKADLPSLTEGRVQGLLAERAMQKKHDIIVPNTGAAFGWESDLISVMKNRFIHEYEIKVSRADWLAELRKARAPLADPAELSGIRCQPNIKSGRHQHLLRGKQFEAKIKAGDRHEYGGYMVDGFYSRNAGPNYFWLVTADNVVKPDELPDYAGHMIVTWDDFLDGYKIKEARPAPRLHGLKACDRIIQALARGVTLRYWQDRNGKQ